MRHSRFVSLTLIVTMVVSLGCALPTTIILQNTDLISTRAAQTVIADITEAAMSAVPSALPSAATSTLEPPTATLVSTAPQTQTSTATFTPTQTSSPTATSTPTLTATATLTPTPLIPVISVSVPTNCRSGPGLIYDWEGALLVGETAQIFGRNTLGNYWYIRNPDSPYQFCWVWGEYATVVGNIASLPVYTPPPTPTPTMTSTPQPDFDVSYSSTDNCNNNYWVEIKLKNTGSIPFMSQTLTVKDIVTGVSLSNYVDGFTDNNGCLTSNTRDTLGAGKTYTVSAPAFNYDPHGHKIRLTITLCSNAGQSGTCLTQTINFKP